MRIALTAIVLAVAALAPPRADAFDLTAELQGARVVHHDAASLQVAQDDGMSLSEAIESVRRRTGGRIVSAETKVQGGREVHHIKVLTKDGKVRTHKVNGRRR